MTILTLIAQVLTKDLQILDPVKAVSGVVCLKGQPFGTGDNLKDEGRGEGEGVRLVSRLTITVALVWVMT